ncbi:hypothetical protein HK405_004539 [Cladochytrium tenue]|nr:hypothetical protein HK405_004539 [Cladochytrium tenue]
MYLREVHAEKRIAELRAFIRAHPLGLLTTAIDGGGEEFPFLQASRIPFVLDDPVDDSADGPVAATEGSGSTAPAATTAEVNLGTLRGHIARANPQARAMVASLRGDGGAGSGGQLAREVLVMFTSELSSYVSPSFYVASKPTTGRVVPTWNYISVEVRGRATVHYWDAEAGPETAEATTAFLQRQMADLTRECEEGQAQHDGREGREKAWQVGDAPPGYIAGLQRAVIGVEITITAIAGKWKMSQESGEADREGVIAGFEALGTDLGRGVAAVVRERAPQGN